MAQPVIMHVNYCEQGQTIEEMCTKAVHWGFDGIEFRRRRRSVPESVEEYLDAIAAAQRKSGLRYVLFGGPGPDLMVSSADEREANLAEYEHFFTLAAQRFELTVCNTMAGSLRNPDRSVPYAQYDKQGSAVATEEHWQQAAQGFKRLGELAGTLGFRLAFETHMGYLHDLPAPSRRLVDMIDNPAVGINLDHGNVVFFQGTRSVADSIAECGDRLYYVHLKNSVRLPSGGRLASALGEGEINNREFLQLLKASGYDGPLCIEAPRAGDREWYAQQDIRYVRAVLSELDW